MKRVFNNQKNINTCKIFILDRCTYLKPELNNPHVASPFQFQNYNINTNNEIMNMNKSEEYRQNNLIYPEESKMNLFLPSEQKQFNCQKYIYNNSNNIYSIPQLSQNGEISKNFQYQQIFNQLKKSDISSTQNLSITYSKNDLYGKYSPVNILQHNKLSSNKNSNQIRNIESNNFQGLYCQNTTTNLKSNKDNHTHEEQKYINGNNQFIISNANMINSDQVKQINQQNNIININMNKEKAIILNGNNAYFLQKTETYSKGY